MVIEKIKILGAILELPAKQHCQFSPFGPTSEVNGLDWQFCLAGSSKTAARILIFSIAIDAYYSYQVKNSEIWAHAFFKHNNSFIAAVSSMILLINYDLALHLQMYNTMRKTTKIIWQRFSLGYKNNKQAWNWILKEAFKEHDKGKKPGLDYW